MHPDGSPFRGARVRQRKRGSETVFRRAHEGREPGPHRDLQINSGLLQPRTRPLKLAKSSDRVRIESGKTEVDAELGTDYPFPTMSVTQARRTRRAREPLSVDASALAASARLTQARFADEALGA